MLKQTIGVIAIALLVMTIASVTVTNVWAHRDEGRYAHRDTTVIHGPRNTYVNREGTYYGPNGYAHRDSTVVIHKSPWQNQYDLGWRNGYADHVRGNWYLNLALSQAYSQGYNDGWNAWRG